MLTRELVTTAAEVLQTGLTAIADDLTVDTPVESSWDLAILVVVTMTLQPNEGLSRPVTWPT